MQNPGTILLFAHGRIVGQDQIFNLTGEPSANLLGLQVVGTQSEFVNRLQSARTIKPDQ